MVPPATPRMTVQRKPWCGAHVLKFGDSGQETHPEECGGDRKPCFRLLLVFGEASRSELCPSLSVSISLYQSRSVSQSLLHFPRHHHGNGAALAAARACDSRSCATSRRVSRTKRAPAVRIQQVREGCTPQSLATPQLEMSNSNAIEFPRSYCPYRPYRPYRPLAIPKSPVLPAHPLPPPGPLLLPPTHRRNRPRHRYRTCQKPAARRTRRRMQSTSHAAAQSRRLVPSMCQNESKY